MDPPLEPPIEGRISSFVTQIPLSSIQPDATDPVDATPPIRLSQLGASYLRAALTHQQTLNQLVPTLHYQYAALRIALSHLDHNILTISGTFDAIAMNAQRELDKQSTLLAGVDADLDMINRVSVHRDFVSLSVRRAMDAGERGRTLGDYVSKEKMRQVADACSRSHGECCSSRS